MWKEWIMKTDIKAYKHHDRKRGFWKTRKKE
jgi:hypothetical protein